MYKLFHGSRNPPIDIPIFLKNKEDRWGMGEAYLTKKKGALYFKFLEFDNLWYGSPKEDFVAWMPIPKE